jgi:hypothetical protein
MTYLIDLATIDFILWLILRLQRWLREYAMIERLYTLHLSILTLADIIPDVLPIGLQDVG